MGGRQLGLSVECSGDGEGHIQLVCFIINEDRKASYFWEGGGCRDDCMTISHIGHLLHPNNRGASRYESMAFCRISLVAVGVNRICNIHLDQSKSRGGGWGVEFGKRGWRLLSGARSKLVEQN